jgi:hypothetical protein
VITHTGHTKSKKGSVPLFMEFPVNPHLAPFLVTRARSGDAMSLWVERVKNGRIKAALRHVPSLDDYYREVVVQIADKSQEDEWGNTHPLTREGLKAAIAHVEHYGFEELELLAHPQMPWKNVHPSWNNDGRGMVLTLLDLPVQPTPWLPKDTLVVIPRDREMVGFVFLTQERVASVVHNAARGVGIATSRPPPSEGEE